MKPSSNRMRGFTLIEMLVVMAIVALLLTLATPRYFGAIEKSKEVVLQDNLRTVRSLLDKFLADKGRYPKSLDELVQTGYLRSLPVDPITESTQTWNLMESKERDRPGIRDIQSGAQGVTKGGVPYAHL